MADWPCNDRVFLCISEHFVEKHSDVSILFADICNFTPLTTMLRVEKLVETLNDLFGKFDEAADVSLSHVGMLYYMYIHAVVASVLLAAEMRLPTH